MGRGIEIVLSGTAQVCCVHDREKRVLRTPDDALRLAYRVGLRPKPGAKYQVCGCCENVFAALDDIPRLCDPCSGINVHPLGGPLNEPIEGVL